MSQFKIISRSLCNVDCFVVQRDDGAELEILSGYGCGLNAWRVNGQDLLFGYRDGDDIRKIGPDTNAGCRLSPYPGRTAYAKFTWGGNTYQLENNVSWAPHALHGFLQNKEWKFQSFESDSNSCTVEFSCDWPGAFAGFPFPYRAVNIFTFTGETVTVTSRVENLGNKTMPYSEGWHPYFTLGEKIDNLVMKMPETKLALLDSADLPTGNFKDDTRFVDGDKIGDQFINDCFCLGKEYSEVINTGTPDLTNNAVVTLENNKKKLMIWQQAGKEQYNAIQMYTPPDRMSIAIEPMTSEPDALNHHRGLIEIPAGQSRAFQFGFIVIEK